MKKRRERGEKKETKLMIDDGLDLNIKKAYMLMYTFSNDKDIHTHIYIVASKEKPIVRVFVCVHYIDAVKKKEERMKRKKPDDFFRMI